MPFTYTCKDVVSDCDQSIKTATETESLILARRHVAKAHDIPNLESDLMPAIRKAIHRSGPGTIPPCQVDDPEASIA